jgi:hypothetical protein
MVDVKALTASLSAPVAHLLLASDPFCLFGCGCAASLPTSSRVPPTPRKFAEAIRIILPPFRDFSFDVFLILFVVRSSLCAVRRFPLSFMSSPL